MKHKFLFISLVIIIILVAIIFLFKDNTDQYLKEITYQEYQEKINKKNSFILYIKQDGCSHCQAFTPVFEKVLSKYKITAYNVNLTNLSTDDYNSLQSQINFEGTPTVAFIENGKELGAFARISGEKSEATIIDKLKLRGYISE